MFRIIKTVRLYWRQILVIALPVLLSPLVFPYSKTSQESKCMFLVLISATFWIVELFPIPVTALLLIALRPVLGLAAAKDGIKMFFSDITILIMGGVVVAIALETTMLHKRMAYMVLYRIGLQPRRLLFGITLISGCLSMWISNTAAATLMLPITKALLQRLYAEETASDGHTEIENENEITEDWTTHDGQNDGESVPMSTKDSIADESAHCNNDRHQQTRQKLDEILAKRHKESNDHLTSDELEIKDHREKGRAKNGPKKLNFERTQSAFSLAITFATNIGGIGTLIGSPTNLILNQELNKWNSEAVLSFAQWSSFGMPCALVILFLAYVWISTLLFGIRSTVTCTEQRSKREIRLAADKVKEELDDMGPLKYNEKTVLVHFIVLVTLWLTRRPGFVTGWSVLFPEGSIKDSTVSLAVAISLFAFTNERPAVFCFRAKGDERPPRSVPSLLSWKVVGKKFPWNVIILIGGGAVLVDSIRVSGLAESIASYMLALKSWPHWLVCLMVIVGVCFITELCSNSVVSILTLPVIRTMSVIMGVHPLYLMLPACVSASMAFMLPVATPPSSLVYSYGGVKLPDMAKAGFVMNILSIFVIFVAIHTWGWLILQLGTIPEWAKLPLNGTDVFNSSSLNSTLWPPEVESFKTLVNQNVLNDSMIFI